MSSGQLRLWFMEQLSPGTAANNLSLGLHLAGDLDRVALERSLSVVVARHEALRTTFDWHESGPVQLVHEHGPPPLSVIDLSDRAAADLDRECYRVARGEASRPFDLRAGPLLRACLLRLAPHSHVLLCVFHHIVVDNWSLGLFARELAECYAAFTSGAQPDLPPVRLQYADYAVWQQDWLSSEAFRRKLAGCAAALRGVHSRLAFSPGPPACAEPSSGGASRSALVPDDLAAQLRSTASSARTTLFAVLLAGFQVLLARYSRGPDIVVGMPVAGRTGVELEGIIGLVANLVVVRTDLSTCDSFIDLLGRVRDASLDALEHQDVPFERLVQAVHPSRSLGANPLFQVLFASVKATAPIERFGALTAHPYVVAPSAVPFDLSMSIVEDANGRIWATADYRTDLFDEAGIGLLLDRYLDVLRRIAARPEARLSEFGVPDLSVSRPREAPSGQASHPAEPGSEIRPNPDRQPLPGGSPGAGIQPRDEVEETLARLWQDVLNVRPPNVTASFFDLGGHSLMAIGLMSGVSRAFGRQIPLSLLFQEPTIDGMARRLRGEQSTTLSVVPISGLGGRPPFFAGGSSREYRDLSRALGPDQPFYQMDVYGLQEQRLLSGHTLYTSVPDLASHFLNDLLKVQPTGPYYLGGQCDGGIIALEIALQLQKQGRPVALLAQFDTPVDGAFRKLHWVQRGWKILRSGQLPARLRQQFLTVAGRHAPLSAQEEQHRRIWQAIWAAIGAYRPDRLFEGQIQLFRAQETYGVFEDVVVGWEGRATGGVRIHEAPGNHFQFFLNPVSQRMIAKVIEESDNGPRSP